MAAALAAAEDVIALEPAFHWGHYFRGWALDALGEAGHAVDARTRAVSLTSGDPVMRAGLAISLAWAGDHARAADELERISRAANRFAYDAAIVAVASGEPERARQALQCARTGRSGWIAYVDIDSRLDALRPLAAD